MKNTKKKESKKFRPQTTKGLVTAIYQGRQIDGRTSVAKSIREIKQAVRCDLNETAQALLESDSATAAVVQQLALQQAFKDTSKIIGEDGKPHHALNSWMKFAGIKRAALLALRKFQINEPDDEDQKTIGDLILEVSEQPGDADTES